MRLALDRNRLQLVAGVVAVVGVDRLMMDRAGEVVVDERVGEYGMMVEVASAVGRRLEGELNAEGVVVDDERSGDDGNAGGE